MGRKIKYLALIMAVVLAGSVPKIQAAAAGCPDLRVVFARGSGGEHNSDSNYLEYKATIESKLKTTNLKYEFIDLDYPAVGIGLDKLGVTIGAYVGAGDAYEFGDSVNKGVKSLIRLVNSNTCPNTKYVLGGYSQGAMVISKALGYLDKNKIIYAATFGDPKIYLPEGEGAFPVACKGKNLSDYRVYVPDCYAYKGLLGSYIPYQPESMIGKLGTWCNKRDIFCSSRSNISHHLSYTSDKLYEDASRIIFDKVAKHFGVVNNITSPHDTAFLIDSTGSMEGLIEKYKSEALRLAKETLDSGGRVALYDYRDLDDPYLPVEHCNFENCTYEAFKKAVDNIKPYGGGDDLESMLSASLHVMKTLKWKFGATKSLVVLTDDGFLMPDRDGVTMAEVVKLSKNIDPVNFYIITNENMVDTYRELAAETDGKVAVLDDKISLLTNYIMERYDSLPRVEEEETPLIRPNLSIKKIEDISGAEFRVNFESDAMETLVIVNDKILGKTSEKEITLGGLDRSAVNKLVLVPIAGEVKGDGVEIEIPSSILVPKAPNTGTYTGFML